MINDFIRYTILLILIAGVCAVIANKFGKDDKDSTTTPVEETTKVDSIIKINDSIKVVVEYLNNDKNEEIIKIKKLNNDSTLMLFYKLIESE